MIKAIRGNKTMKKKREKKVMNFEETKSGFAVIRINNDEYYVSFGKEEQVKWISLHFNDGAEVVTKMYPVALGKIPANATKCIGKKNITRIRELVRDGLVDGKLPRKYILKMGKIINKENEQ
jgi:hypothetical protein